MRYLVAIGVLHWGCGDDEGSAARQNDSPCEAVAACDGDEGRAMCEALFDLVVADSACQAAIEAATCEEHAMDLPPYLDVCLPPCAGREAQCMGNAALATCLDFEGTPRAATVRCEAACATKGASYAGTCGTEFEGQTSSVEKCWCRAGGSGNADAETNPPDRVEGVSVSTEEAVDPELLCVDSLACGVSCTYDIDYVLVTDECLAAIEAASCEEHDPEMRPYRDTCFPRCEDPTAFCNDDGTVTVCETGFDPVLRWRTYSCQRICEEERGERFSGNCVATYRSSGDPWPDCGCEDPF